MLTTFQKIGKHRNNPRIWLESPRLQQLGFVPKTFLDITPAAGGLCLKPTTSKTKHRVSFRNMSGLPCPIIDLNGNQMLQAFQGHTELKLQASHQTLRVQPSTRSFHILSHRQRGLPISTVEYFCGGGTLSPAITADPRFQLVGAVEISPKFAAHFVVDHPDVPLFMCDIRDLDPLDLPPVAFMFASLPCTCFSTAGVAKKGLKGRQETGDTGDLFVAFTRQVAHHMPLAVMVENVPAFFNSAMAGPTLMVHLERLGYHVHFFEIHPYDEWGEPQDRRRGVMVATLFNKFYPSPPMRQFQGCAGDYLDQPNAEQDRKDAERIANMIQGRIRHMERHRAAGNGFGFTTINHQSLKVPTLLRSYYKCNIGPFVETPYGLRMLRQREIERLMGFKPAKGFTSHSYSTAVEILGQGVQTRVFRQLVQQLGDFIEFHLTGRPASRNLDPLVASA